MPCVLFAAAMVLERKVSAPADSVAGVCTSFSACRSRQIQAGLSMTDLSRRASGVDHWELTDYLDQGMVRSGSILLCSSDPGV